MGAPILAPATLLGFCAQGIQLAPSGSEQDAIGGNSQFDYGVSGRNGAPVRQGDVVDDIATLVGLACKRNQHIGMRLQPLGIAGQNCAIFGTEIRPVEVEMDVFDILPELLLLIPGKQPHRGHFDVRPA
jgi:hypothetical protein